MNKQMQQEQFNPNKENFREESEHTSEGIWPTGQKRLKVFHLRKFIVENFKFPGIGVTRQ
jgi:hypothetical protein